MKKLIIFLLITFLLIVVCDFYFEYAVSREIPAALSYVTTVAMIVIVAFYFRYLVKTIINLLNLKKQ